MTDPNVYRACCKCSVVEQKCLMEFDYVIGGWLCPECVKEAEVFSPEDQKNLEESSL